MSEMEEESILENPSNEEVLADLDKEEPKPLLLLIAVILGSLSLILSLVAIVQTKQDSSSASPGIEPTNIDGGVGVDNILTRLEALEQSLAQQSAVPSEFNGGNGSAVEHEVGTLRTELDALRAKVDNLRLGIATTNTVTAAPTPTPPPAAPSIRPPEPTLTVPPGGTLHILKSGETLTALSKKYGVPLQKIQAANQGLDDRKLQIGSKIIIPSP